MLGVQELPRGGGIASELQAGGAEQADDLVRAIHRLRTGLGWVLRQGRQCEEGQAGRKHKTHGLTP
jgi:hypothetical protein